jgi:hypothetical protein
MSNPNIVHVFIKVGGVNFGAIELGVVDELGAVEFCVVELGAVEFCVVELGAVEFGVVELGDVELGVVKAGAAELGAVPFYSRINFFSYGQQHTYIALQRYDK